MKAYLVTVERSDWGRALIKAKNEKEAKEKVHDLYYKQNEAGICWKGGSFDVCEIKKVEKAPRDLQA